jgi:hypothetical protein
LFGVTLAWNSAGSPAIAGYHVYYGGATGTYTQRLETGNTTQISVANLVGGQTYFFVVTAYGWNGGESTPSNEITYTAPVSSAGSAVVFSMNGIADSSGYLQNSTGMTIYAAVRGTKLYVATWSPGIGGGPNDHFVFVSDQLLTTATIPVPWGKIGTMAVPSNKPYLASESTNSYVAWFNAPTDSQAAKAPTNSGVMEGVLDLVETFGSIPQKIYIAAAAYQTFNGGMLVSQGPIGNGDHNIDPNEFRAIWTATITDQYGYGVYDWLNPNVSLHAQITRTSTGTVSISWPSVPGKTYEAGVADLFSGISQVLQSPVTAGIDVLRQATSYAPTNWDSRYYYVKCLNP